jgi:hypothetical protein
VVRRDGWALLQDLLEGLSLAVKMPNLCGEGSALNFPQRRLKLHFLRRPLEVLRVLPDLRDAVLENLEVILTLPRAVLCLLRTAWRASNYFEGS